MEKKIDRYKSMNKLKKNEGFSLVELIVVVLIMAIIATALTLAVTKYVAKAKRSSDVNTAGELKSAMEMALMDGMTGASNAIFEIPDGDIYLKFTTDTMSFSQVSGATIDTSTLTALAQSALGSNPIKSKVYPNEYFVLTLEKTNDESVEIKCTYTVHSTINPFDYTY